MEGNHTNSIIVKRFNLSDEGCLQYRIYEPVSKAIICSGRNTIKIPVIRLILKGCNVDVCGICPEHELHISY